MSRGGSTRAWRELRLKILARDANTCAYCGAEAKHVDHIIPVAHGGTDDEENLTAACARCNLAKKEKEGRGGGKERGGKGIGGEGEVK